MTTVQVSAQELFRSAYENRYTWDKSFPGYTADVTLKQDGEVYSGKVRVSSALKPEVFDIENDAAKQAVQGQLFEITIHRVRRTFQETHGKNSFSYGNTDETGAVEILLNDNPQGDRYKVRDNEVCMVHRHIHGVVVTINTFSTQHTEQGYLSHRYDSVYHDPKTGEQKGGISQFEDEYEKVGDYYIMSRRWIQTETDGTTSTQEFLFSNIQLLDPATA